MTEKGKDRVGTFSNRSSITSFKLSMREPVVQYTALYVGMTHYYISIVSSHLANLDISLSNSVWTNQFDNTANRRAHIETTGPEIWRQTDGKVSAVTFSTGTGGTLAGWLCLSVCFLKVYVQHFRCWNISKEYES